MQGKTKKNTKKSSLNKSCFPNNTKLHQPHLFCYFIESGRSLSTFLKTKTIVALNTGQSLWGLFPLKSLLITLQCMWVIIQGTLLTGFATVMNSNLKSSRNPSATFLLDCSLCLPPQYVSCLYVNSSSSWGKKWVCAGFHKRRLRDSSHQPRATTLQQISSTIKQQHLFSTGQVRGVDQDCIYPPERKSKG